MECPFLKESVNIEAQIRSMNLRQRVIRPRWDVLSFSDDVLFECFHFFVQSIIYLNNILSPRIVCTLSVQNKFSVQVHVSKATVCRAVTNAVFEDD